MPIYDFYDKRRKKTFEKFLKIAELDAYLAENPHIIRDFSVAKGPAIIDPVRLGIRKVDPGFKEILKQVHQTTPGSQLNKTTNF